MKSMRKIIAWMLLILFGFTSGAAAQTIELVGTDDGESIFEALAEAFNASNADVEIELPDDISSTGGIKAVGRDEALLGRVARDIREHEQHYGLSYVPFAKSQVVFFVHKSAGIQNLSSQQILDIYSGKITNWRDVGGNDMKIRVVSYEEGDSNREVLGELLPGFDELAITSKSKTVYDAEETFALAEEKKGVIAFGSYVDALEKDVVIVSVDEKSADESDYPYAITLGFVFKEANYSGPLKNFIEFATSEAAYAVIEQAGGMPLKK